MAYDVFLSYARADSDRAMVIKDALEALDLSVFFDVDDMDGGDEFPDVIRDEIIAAGATVAVWSTHALTRDWVRRECEIARQHKTLVPIEIGPLSDSVMTVSLSRIHRLNLHDFDGNSDHPGWQRLVRALAKKLRRPDLIKVRREKAREENRIRRLSSELEQAERINAYLRRLNPGWRPWQIATVAAVSLVMISAAVYWGWQQTEARAETERYLQSPEWNEVSLLMAQFDENARNSREALSTILEKTDLAKLERAAKVNSRAALLTGWAYDFSVSMDAPNEVKATKLYRNACDAGLPRGCRNLAIRYDLGEGTNQSDDRAIKFYTQACETKDFVACNILGTKFDSEEYTARVLKEAVRLYRLSCEGGFQGGCNNLASKSAKGEGIEKDINLAVQLYEAACDADYAISCLNLAELYWRGEAREQDPTRIADLYETSCEAEHWLGCTKLGVIHALGVGRPQSDALAADFYKKACDGRNQQGCAYLGESLVVGLGLDQDEAAGLEILRSACLNENQWACDRAAALTEPNETLP